MTSGPSPTARRRELAKYFRDLRHQRGYQLDQVAEALSSSVSKVSRLEAGLRGISLEDVRRLGRFYSLSDAKLSKLLQIAREGRGRAWWDQAANPPPMRTFIGVEQVATMIATFSCNIIPGLLQTEAYARALVAGTHLDPDPTAQAAVVADRLRRQQRLNQPDPPWLWAILDESALHRIVGSPTEMRQQLTALLAASQRTRISIRVIPFRSGAHPGLDNQFSMLHVGDDQALELVHLDGISGSINLDRREDFGRYRRAWDELATIALSPQQSADLIERIIDQLEP